MDGSLDVDQEVGQKSADRFTHLFINIDLVKEVILKYLDGSAMLNLSGVNSQIRSLVTYSKQFKKCVNLRVSTKTMDFYTAIGEPVLPEWTAQLTSLTLVCNSEFGPVSPEHFSMALNSNKFSTFVKILPNLSTLEINTESQSLHQNNAAANFINKILGFSSNIKSLSLSYDLLLNPLNFNYLNEKSKNLEELKFTTCPYMIKVKDNENFMQNLNSFVSNCINLKIFSCQEVSKVGGRYVNTYDQYCIDDFDGIWKIIEKNCAGLEKLEFGISQLFANYGFFSNFLNLSFPKLSYFDLRAVAPHVDDYNIEFDYYPIDPPVSTIIDKLFPEGFGQLTTLKLAIKYWPIELFHWIPLKFPQLKSLSLKASIYGNNMAYNESTCWSFLQSLVHLEELEITRFITDRKTSDFGLQDIEHFVENFLPKNKLRKLALRGVIKGLEGSTASLIEKISKMIKLKELAITGVSYTLDDFMKICANLKILEKFEISFLYPAAGNGNATTTTTTDEYGEISDAFSSLKYLKEMSIDLWSGDFSKVLKSISFPYLKTLTLVNSHQLEGDELLHNIVGLNRMLKKVSIVSFTEGNVQNQDQIFAQGIERNNLQIENYLRWKMVTNPTGHGEVREDLDPDSKPVVRW